MIWWSFWWVSGCFGLSFVYLLDILICIIRLFLFLEKSPCICKVKRFIFMINYYLSGNIMWPVYLSQMWISRLTCHLSFFCISCSCSSKHLKRLQLCTGGMSVLPSFWSFWETDGWYAVKQMHWLWNLHLFQARRYLEFGSMNDLTGAECFTHSWLWTVTVSAGTLTRFSVSRVGAQSGRQAPLVNQPP